jgi:hypothetical protein
LNPEVLVSLWLMASKTFAGGGGDHFGWQSGLSFVRVMYLGVLQKGNQGGRRLVWRSAHALLSTVIQYNISPLHAQPEQCARVTVERTPPRRMFFDPWISALASRCMKQIVRSRANISTVKCRSQVKWRG